MTRKDRFPARVLLNGSNMSIATDSSEGLVENKRRGFRLLYRLLLTLAHTRQDETVAYASLAISGQQYSWRIVPYIFDMSNSLIMQERGSDIDS